MKWEYKTIISPATGGLLKTRVDAAPLDAMLNQLGQDHWELVSSFVISGEMTREVFAIFKRPLAQDGGVSESRGACPGCGYDLRGADHHACPECGWQAVPDA